MWRQLPQLSNRLRRLPRLSDARQGGSQYKTREGEPWIAVNRFAGVGNGLIVPPGHETRNREGQRSQVKERLPRAQADRFLGMRNPLVVITTDAPRQGVEAEHQRGV